MKKTLSFVCLVAIMIGAFASAMHAEDAVISSTQKTESLTPSNDSKEIICVDDEGPMYISLEKRRYDVGETVSAKLNIVTTEKCEGITYSAEGFEILRERMAVDGRFIELDFSSRSGEAVFEANAVIGGKNVASKIYAISTDKGIFLSYGAIDSAWDEYFYSGVTDGEYSFEEYNRRWVKYLNENSQGIITTTEVIKPEEGTRASAGTITVSGLIRWVDDDGVAHPLQYNRIDFYDDSYSMYVGTTTTNVEGMYSFNFDSSGFSGVLYMEIYPGNAHSMVKTYNGGKYSFYSYISSELEAGDRVVSNVDINMTSTLGQTFQISQAVHVAAEYVNEMDGEYLPAVTVKYPHQNPEKTGCYYNMGTINIIGLNSNEVEYAKLKPYSSWDVIMHEYGHHVEYAFGIIGCVNDGRHSYSWDLATVNGNSKRDGIRLAWHEAYATVFGVMAQEYFCDKSSYDVVAYLGRNIYTVGDTRYDSYNTEDYNLETITHLKGEACEGSVAAVLWDLHDSVADYDDEISISHSLYWQIVTNSSAVTFSDFATYFTARYPGYVDSFGKLLGRYKMSVGSISYNSSTATLSWMKNGMTEKSNNKFVISVYIPDFIESPIFITSATETSNVGSHEIAYYQFTSSQLEIMQDYSSVIVVVWAYQTDCPTTGAYPSRYKTINFS